MSKIDYTYTAKYAGGVTINPLAVLKEEIEFVDGETNEDYYPDLGTFWFDRPDLNKRFVLTGTFTEEPLGPTPVEGKTLFIYGKNANGQWLNESGEVSERPVGLMMTQLPTDTEMSITLPTITGFAVDDSKPAVDFGGTTVGTVEGTSLVISIEDDTNAVVTYKEA